MSIKMADSNHRIQGGYTSLPASNVPGSVPAAAGPDHIVLPFQGAESNLQTFPPSDARSKLLGSFPPSHEADDSFGSNAAESMGNEGRSGLPHVFKITSYRSYFNVDTADVSERIIQSFLVNRREFLEKTNHNPDMYGPFWICTTLIFVAAALGNYATYLSTHESWNLDISKVNWAAGLFYGYTCVLPLAIYFLLKYLNLSMGIVQLWCLYGYSLFVFIPASVLSIIPVEAFRWVIIAIAGLTSASFVAFNLKSHIGVSEWSIIIAIGSFVVQCCLALTLKIIFFR